MGPELKHTLRSLRREPGSTVAVLVTLALGIGATCGVFSVVHGVLLKALPYPRPERLVRVWETDAERGEDRGAVAAANLADWRATGVFASLAAYRPNYFNLAGRGEPTRVIGAAVTSGFFPTLGVAPSPGRGFTRQEGEPGGPPAVVLSHRLWRDAFNANPAVVGSTVRVEGHPHTVVGIAAPGFHFPDPRFDLWVPWVTDADALDRSRHRLQVVGRLADGVSVESARRELEAVAARLADSYPETNRGRSVRLLPLHEEVVGDTRPLLLTLFLATLFVLLIACANVANLLLARSMAHRRELAVRVAMGAGRRRLFVAALGESALLTAAGAALGLLLAGGGIALFHARGPELPRAEAVGLDLQVFVFAVAVALASALVFALLPVLGAFPRRPAEVLKATGGRAGGSGRSLRSALVVSQIALAFVLLLGAGLLIRGFHLLQSSDLGFRTGGVLKMDVSLPVGEYAEVDRIVDVFRRVLAEVETLPGAEATALASSLPLSGTWASRSFIATDSATATAEAPQHADYRLISPGYLEILNIPLLRGRGPAAAAGDTPWVLVNESLARRTWPGGEAVGRRISFSGPEGPWWTVRGVVGDVHHSGRGDEAEPAIYQDVRDMPWPWPTMSLVVRSGGPPMALAPAVRRRVWSVDPDLPVTGVSSLQTLVDRELVRPRFTVLLMNLFALTALLLAAVGIYGVMAYAVNRRSHEIGIRLALGARRRQVFAMVLRQALLLAGVGLALGLTLAALVAAVFRNRLFGIGGLEPLTVAAVLLVLAAVAVAASSLPARRATRVEPVEALRQL